MVKIKGGVWHTLSKKYLFGKGRVKQPKEDYKGSWHVKWREYNPISWLLCWLFEQNYSWMPMFFYYVHDWFCPGYQEVKEAQEDYKAGRFKKVRDLLTGK